jgi:galactoside O-acetyltransferase
VDSNLSPHEIGEMSFAAVGDHCRIDRRAAFFNPGAIRIGDHVRVDAFSVLAGGSEELSIGSYVHVGAACYLSAGDGGIRIADFCTLAPRVALHGHSDDYRGGTLTGGVVPPELTGGKGGPIVLEEHVIIGSGSVILPAVTLGYGAAVGALTVVRKSVGAGNVVGGNPASGRGTRDVTRLDELAARARAQLNG